MCDYCEKPYRTIVECRGVSAFVGEGCLFLRFDDKEANMIIVNMSKIKYCPICRRKFKEAK